jgi:hypothetical protein
VFLIFAGVDRDIVSEFAADGYGLLKIAKAGLKVNFAARKRSDE